MTNKKINKYADPNSLIGAFKQKEDEDFKVEFLQLKQKYEQLLEIVNKTKTKEDTGQGTVRQICLAFYYMNKAGLTPRKSGTPLNDAEFLTYITGLSTDNIRKTINDPLAISGDDKEVKKAKSLLNDLKKVRHKFEKILFAKGVELINEDIKIYENTIRDYKTVE